MRTRVFLSLFSLLLTLGLSGCSNFNFDNINTAFTNETNPLKTEKDRKIESVLTSGTWKYQRQSADCKDTTWTQRFHKNRYYKSGGSACLLKDAFSVDAESWHIKNQRLYIVNLSPSDDDDIILKYGIDFLDNKKLILSSKGFKYTFLK